VPLYQNNFKCKNYSSENYFDLHKNELAGRTLFHKNDFAIRLVLTQRLKATGKWSIAFARLIAIIKEHGHYNTQVRKPYLSL